MRDKLVADTEALLATDAGEDVLAAAQAWLDARGEAEGLSLIHISLIAHISGPPGT